MLPGPAIPSTLTLCWINLETAVRRRAAMAQQLAALGLAGVRIRAVTPADISPGELRRYSNPRSLHYLSPMPLACSLSHAAALRAIAASGSGWGLVLEDDAVLSKRLPAFLDALLADPPPTDLVRIESVPDVVRLDPQPVATYAGIDLRRAFGRPNGSAGYLVTAAAAALIAESRAIRHHPMDVALFEPYDALGRRLRIVHADPGLCIQNDFLIGRGIDAEPSMMRDIGQDSPFWSGLRARLRKIDREVRVGTLKTLDTWRTKAEKRAIPFDPG